MRVLPIVPLFMLLSCASRPERNVASEVAVLFGHVDTNQSLVKLFPVESDGAKSSYFYLELRDGEKKLVDVELRDIMVRNRREELEAKIQRISEGKYEIHVLKEIFRLKQIQFLVQNKRLKFSLVNLQKPSRENSKILILSNVDHQLKLKIILRDKHGHPLDMPQAPELLIEGNGVISELEPIEKGIWHLSLTYPDDNQIFYFSLRANGVYLERLLRFQHLEK
jgi:hypothetical protein